MGIWDSLYISEEALKEIKEWGEVKMNNYWESIYGWFDYHTVYNDAVERYNNCTFLELGSFQGRSMSYLASKVKEKNKDISLISVDLFPTKEELNDFRSIGAFQGAEGDLILNLPKSLIDTFADNMRYSGVEDIVTPMKGSTEKIGKLFQKMGCKFPFIFVDSGHGYATVMKDLEIYWELLTDQSTMAGHDYDDFQVSKAVNDFFNPKGVNIENLGSSWRVRKG